MRPLTIPLLLTVALGCASTSVTTTVLPPHRLYAPVCPSAVLVHDTPGELPSGGIVLARIRVEGGSPVTTNEKLRRRLQQEAAKLGANRLLASEVTTPGTLAALGMTVAQSYNPQRRDQIQSEAITDQNQSTRATAPLPTDPSFYGRGLAYAIYVPDDTLRTQLECSR